MKSVLYVLFRTAPRPWRACVRVFNLCSPHRRVGLIKGRGLIQRCCLENRTFLKGTTMRLLLLLLAAVFGLALAKDFPELKNLVSEADFLTTKYDCVIFINDQTTSGVSTPAAISAALSAYANVSLFSVAMNIWKLYVDICFFYSWGKLCPRGLSSHCWRIRANDWYVGPIF